MLNDIYQSLDPVALSIGPLQVRWYGLAYILGFICAGVIVSVIARKWKLKFQAYDALVLTCYIAIGILIGARVIYCIVYGDGYYFKHPLKFFAVNQGGMSFHGGLVGAVVAGLIYAKFNKMPALTLADLIACGAPIGLLFGRIANFINGELYGAPTTSSLGVDFTGSGVLYLPSQLLEACLEGFVLLFIMHILARKVPPRPRGFYIGVFLVLYGIFRCCVEFIRLPDSQVGYLAGDWLTMGMVLCIPMIVVGIILVLLSFKQRKEQMGIGK